MENLKKILKINDNDSELWEITTLRKLGKDEKYLEDIIFNNPELLHTTSLDTGIHGPYKAFRQISISSPQERSNIVPDLILISASGHLIIVEIKLNDNPELKDRRVISQIIDYASSISLLETADLINLFSDNKSIDSWYDFIRNIFPEIENVEEIANKLLKDISQGNLNLIIACDKAPQGVYELIESITKQNMLSFTLSLIEIVPFKNNSNNEIIFIPKEKVKTKIINRSAITINYNKIEDKPSINIQANSLLEIEESIKEESSPKRRRNLSYEELRNLAIDNDIVELYDYFLDKFKNFYDYKTTTQTGISFIRKMSGRHNNIFSLLVSDGSKEKGLPFRINNINRILECFNITKEGLIKLLPLDLSKERNELFGWGGEHSRGGYFSNKQQINDFINYINQ